MGIKVYDICKHPNRSQFEWENRKKRFFPPKLLLVKEFVHIVDPIDNLKLSSKGK